VSDKDYVDDDASVPPLSLLDRGEVVRQTRRTIDRPCDAGKSPAGPSWIIIGAQKSGATFHHRIIPSPTPFFYIFKPNPNPKPKN
jgi:hypothetical protein